MNDRVGAIRRSPRHVGIGLLLGAGLATLAAACSTSPAAAPAAHRSPRQVVLASVTDTESASSAAIDITVSVNGTPSLGGSSSAKPVSASVTGHGVFSFADKTGEMTFTASSPGSSSSGSVQVRKIGDQLYVSSPRLPSLDGGKSWVVVNVNDFQKAQGQNGGPFGSLSDGDPTQILGLLQRIGASVTEVGTSDIDGVPTTEYRAQIDLAGSGTGSSAVISSQEAQALGLSTIPVDLWVDSAGRARQVSTSFSVIGLTIKATVGFGSFGTPVSVSAPPSSEVADGSSLLSNGQLGSLLGGTDLGTPSG